MSQPASRAQSRAPSQDRADGPSQQRQPSRRGRSRSHRSPSVANAVGDSGAEEASPVQGQRRRNGNRRRRGGMPAVEEVNTSRQVANTAGNAVRAGEGTDPGAVARDGDEDEGMGDKPLKLRLDLNLDADIRLTAKVHGDLTLCLLR